MSLHFVKLRELYKSPARKELLKHLEELRKEQPVPVPEYRHVPRMIELVQQGQNPREVLTEYYSTKDRSVYDKERFSYEDLTI